MPDEVPLAPPSRHQSRWRRYAPPWGKSTTTSGREENTQGHLHERTEPTNRDLNLTVDRHGCLPLTAAATCAAAAARYNDEQERGPETAGQRVTGRASPGW